MRGKKQTAAVVLAVILAVTAGMPHSTVYAEPDSTEQSGGRRIKR